MNPNENPNNQVSPQVVPPVVPTPTTANPVDGPNVQGVVQQQSIPVTPSTEPVQPVVISTEAAPVAAPEVSQSTGSETGIGTIGNGKPPSKFKYFLVIVFFVLLFGLVYFLPNISEFVAIWRAKQAENQEVITTGTLACTLDRTTDKFNVHYLSQFDFADSKIKGLTYTVITKGDITSDADELEKLKTQCDLLESVTSNLEGVFVSCDLSGSEVEQKQEIDYATLDRTKVTAAYAEAGGTYPEFKANQNIDEIQKIMNASGYTCKKNK